MKTTTHIRPEVVILIHEGRYGVDRIRKATDVDTIRRIWGDTYEVLQDAPQVMKRFKHQLPYRNADRVWNLFFLAIALCQNPNAPLDLLETAASLWFWTSPSPGLRTSRATVAKMYATHVMPALEARRAVAAEISGLTGVPAAWVDALKTELL